MELVKVQQIFEKILFTSALFMLLACTIPTNVYAAENQKTSIYSSVPQTLEKNTIFIGDSRTVGISEAVESDATFICESAQGYRWFLYNAVPRLRAILDINPYKSVIIHMGVIECIKQTGGAKKSDDYFYVNAINELVKDYPETDFYVLAVYPANGDYVTHSTDRLVNMEKLNENIKAYNRTMMDKCDAKFINVYRYLKNLGYTSTDGVHPDKDSYNVIYTYAMNVMRYKKNVSLGLADPL